MAIDLSKQNQASALDVLSIEAIGAGAHGTPSLVALALDAHGVAGVDGVVCHARPIILEGALRFAGDAKSLGSSKSADTIEIVLKKLPEAIRTVVLCLAHDAGQPGLQSLRSDVQVRVLEVVQGIEILRRRIVASPGLIHEVVRLERCSSTWRCVEVDSIHRGFLYDLLSSVGKQAGLQELVQGDEPATYSPSAPLAGIDVETGGGYCDAGMRRSFIARAIGKGVPPDEAEIVIDMELDRLRVANEAILLQRLDSILCRFTDDDAKLDDKERRDALQIVCRAAPGYVQGLRHDVADGYVVRFCRERMVKIKVGLLRWAVP